MRSAWSPLLKLAIALAAITPTNVAAAAMPEADSSAVILGFITLAAATTDAWLNAWLGDNYSHAPALMLVLVALFALPPLAIAGFVMRRQRRSPDATVRVSRPALKTAAARAVTTRTELSVWPTEAWVELAGQRYVIGRSMLRIGREADNDICVLEKTVHRYHGVIRRTTDGDVVITDLSGVDGNGVLINGVRVSEGRLKAGDVIGIGAVRLKFDARSV